MEFTFSAKHFPKCANVSFVLSMLLLLANSNAHAAGDAAQGAKDWDYTCKHCHGAPQPGKPGAFSDFDSTANRLSVYASDPSAITKAANEGYLIPEGNTNNDYPPGAKTNEPMRSFAGSDGKHLGTGSTPTPYTLNIAAFFASLFSAPSAPTISNVTAGDAQASVSFNPPKSDLTITGYSVTSSPDGIIGTGISSPINVTGLTNGTAYKFIVTATSNAGTSKPSSSSNIVTPVATAAPVVPVPLVVPVAAPPVTSPKVKAEGVSNKSAVPVPIAAGAAVSILAVPAILAAPVIAAAPVVPAAKAIAAVPTTKSSEVPQVATNKKNKGSATNSASEVQPASNQNVTLAPSLQPPTIKVVKAGSTDARVFFTPPADNSSITGYTVTAISGGASTGITATGEKSPIKITGLTNGTEYTFTVTANSKAGSSVASAKSNPVTPLHILGD